ncbi:MAG TPA: aldo/keto reductase, partial [Mycobacteriales bacterium]|nr:aldo/keto reductase [Mycobacteriales bacterium]
AALTFDTGVPREQAIGTIRAAVEHGVRLIDTAHAYTLVGHPAHNEELIAEALAGVPDASEIVVATKGGHWRAEDGSFGIGGGPTRLAEHARVSRQYLKRDVLDLYFLHWPDAQLPIEESVEGLERLRAAGRIRAIGLSNVDADQLQRARRVAPIAAVQNHFSPFDTSDRPVLEACADAGITYFSYSPLGGTTRARSRLEARPVLADLAAERSVTPQRLALAWLIRSGIVPVVGARRPETIIDSAGAMALADQVGADEIADLTAEFTRA